MSEWQEVKLSTLCQGIYDGPHATPKRLDKGPIFLGISSLNQGSIDLSKSDHLSEDDFKKWTRRVTPKENDLVFSYETRLGEAALIPAGLRCCLGRRMALMRPNVSKVNPQFLLYAYLSPIFQATIKARTVHGSTVNRIPLTELPDYPILVPSLRTQNQIASTLSNLDRKIENLRKQNETLEKIAQILFKHWFVDFEFPFDFAQDKPSTDGKPYKSSGGAMVMSELGEIPAGWRVGCLDDVLSLVIDYRGKTPKKLGSDWSLSGIPALSAKNIKDGQIVREDAINFVDEELYQKWMKDELQKGDVLLTSEAPLGEVLYLANNRKYVLSQRLFALRTSEELNSTYLYLWLKSAQGQFLLERRATGSTVQGIRQVELRKVEITIPPLDYLEPATSVWLMSLEKIENNNQQIRTLTKARDALLPKLMSGKLRVGDSQNE